MNWPVPDRSRAGVNRDRAFYDARRVPLLAQRAILADTATNATNATNTTTVLPVGIKLVLDDDDSFALVTDSSRIQPVTMTSLLAFLESRYVLTPIP